MSQHIHMVSGRMGVTEGFYAASEGITEDNDGEFTGYDGVIDLSRIMSRKLGKQMSQMSNYRVSFVQIDLRNINNAVDNDAGLTAGGVLRWYEPTKHRVNALKALRQVEREKQKSTAGTGTGDPAFPFRYGDADDKMYRGVRYNWDTDAQVYAANDNEYTGIFAGNDYRLVEVLDHYNTAIGGTPTAEGYKDSDTSGAALWHTRVGASPSESDNAVYWVTSFRNRVQEMDGVAYTPLTDSDDKRIFHSFSDPYQLDLGNRHFTVLGGLMDLEVVHTNTDTAGILEDEYYIQVTLGIEGWEEF